MENKVRKIILLKIFVIFFFLSCESKLNYYELSGVSEHVRQYTESYHEPVEKFEEWQAGEKIYGYPVYTETFDKSGSLLESITSSDYSSGPIIIKYNYENDEAIGFSQFNHEGKEIERGKYLDKSIHGWESEVINVDGEVVRNSVLIIENNRIKKRIDNDYENDLRFKYEYQYKDEVRSTALIWKSTIEGSFDAEPNILNYEYLDFDQFGNWNKSLVYKLDIEEPEYIIIREFEYF